MTEYHIRDGEKIELSIGSAEESLSEEQNEADEIQNAVPEDTATFVTESTMTPAEETAKPVETAAPETQKPVMTAESTVTEQPKQTAEPTERPSSSPEVSEE